jgi:copper(I)-binding protein
VVRPRQVLLFGLIGLMCGVVAAPTRHDRGPTASVPLPGHGSLSVDVATADSAGPDAWGYVELRNSSDGPIQIVAMTSQDAKSVTWTTARQVVSITDLYSAGSICSGDRVAEEAANHQSRAIRDLVVPAHGVLSLRSGTDHVTMSGLARPLSAGMYTKLELYLGDLTTSWSRSLPVRLRVE